jgi:hypothetical protein
VKTLNIPANHPLAYPSKPMETRPIRKPLHSCRPRYGQLRVAAVQKVPVRYANKFVQKAWAQGDEAVFADKNSVCDCLFRWSRVLRR